MKHNISATDEKSVPAIPRLQLLPYRDHHDHGCALTNGVVRSRARIRLAGRIYTFTGLRLPLGPGARLNAALSKVALRFSRTNLARSHRC